jgi:hypothetical protein
MLEHAPVSQQIMSEALALAERVYAVNPESHDAAYVLATLRQRAHADAADIQALVDRHAGSDDDPQRWRSFGAQP